MRRAQSACKASLSTSYALLHTQHSGFARRGGDTDKHEHGWGLAIYEGRGLRTFHDPQPAAQSRLAEFVAHYPVQTYSMMAHIRYATQGAVSLENVHPFQREMWGIPWCFCHNGEIPKCKGGQTVKLGTKDQRFLYHPVGDTDSEAFFCTLLNALRAEFCELPTLPVLYETLQRLCAEIVSGEEDTTILNFLLGCGPYTLFAYSWPGARPGSSIWNGLYYTIRRPPFSTASLVDCDYAVDFSTVTTAADRVAVIATAPLTTDEEWKEFKRGQLLLFENGWGYSELYDCHEVEQRGRGLVSKAMPKSQQQARYDTPALLRALVDEVVGFDRKSTVWATKGVDLGCGSGGSGVVFRSCVQHMTGVDISAEMVDIAYSRGCYDELRVGDIGSVLCCGSQTESALFDIVFACNVFSFIHDIRDVFASVRRSLKPMDGVFAFSAEFIEGTDEAKTCTNGDEHLVLQSCARYAHEQSYVDGLAREFGFVQRAMETSDLRQHEGRTVKGVLVVMVLSSNSTC